MAIRLILIRHAQTLWNKQGRYCGSCDIGITKKGIRQARILRRRLSHENIARIYASSKKRAQETARVIFGKAKIYPVAGLREMDFGILEGLTYREIMQRYPALYQKWLKDPHSVNIPQGESLSAFKKRVVRAAKKIISSNQGKTIAIVSHGGAISIFLNHILKSTDFWHWIPASASATILTLNRDGSQLVRGRFSGASKTVPFKKG